MLREFPEFWEFSENYRIRWNSGIILRIHLEFPNSKGIPGNPAILENSENSGILRHSNPHNGIRIFEIM
jgi:hypothetical protein